MKIIGHKLELFIKSSIKFHNNCFFKYLISDVKWIRYKYFTALKIFLNTIKIIEKYENKRLSYVESVLYLKKVILHSKNKEIYNMS